MCDEIEYLDSAYADYNNVGLLRFTFWKSLLNDPGDLEKTSSSELLGYAIIKHDTVPSLNYNRICIFESVSRRYGHRHNFVPGSVFFQVRCGRREFRFKGVMYCQQNSLNKACAQVAIRSLLTRRFPKNDILYSEIHSAAREVSGEFNPAKGLGSNQIRAVLNHFNVNFKDLDYTVDEESITDFPYTKFLYTGIENSHGGLLGFELSGPEACGARHIIPFFGHTFNQDTWVPRAQQAYFHVGAGTRYFSSDEWLSSYIGHDDNFGSNFCVPKKFIEPEQVKYVVSLLPDNARYDGVMAEAVAIDYLYSALPGIVNDITISDNWVKNLIDYTLSQDIVLRAVFLKDSEYTDYLKRARDWSYKTENEKLLGSIKSIMPENMWMVEISIPEIFSTNYSKLGEIILDAGVTDPLGADTPAFIMIRIPGHYFFNVSTNPRDPKFIKVDSCFQSHISLHRKGKLFI